MGYLQLHPAERRSPHESRIGRAYSLQQHRHGIFVQLCPPIRDWLFCCFRAVGGCMLELTKLVIRTKDAVKLSTIPQNDQHLSCIYGVVGRTSLDRTSLADVLSTQSTKAPDVVNGMRESIVDAERECLICFGKASANIPFLPTSIQGLPYLFTLT